MELTDVEVNNRPQIDGSIQVGGYFGAGRVVYEIPRVPLDDYFPQRPDLSDAQRHTLVTSNLERSKPSCNANANSRRGARLTRREDRSGCSISSRATYASN